MKKSRNYQGIDHPRLGYGITTSLKLKCNVALHIFYRGQT